MPARIRGQAGYQAFRDLFPRLGRRAYFAFLFRDLAYDFPDLFAPGPDEPGLPSEDVCEDVWVVWHTEHAGAPVYDWADGTFESRFLGDLYQDLDGDVRKRYALLQTPDFVEKYILDYTLDPAVAAFDPATLAAQGKQFRVLDPTCGSGHFLIGALHRLARYWKEKAPELGTLDRIQRALDAVWGVDINGYAVAIARFRLLLAARELARAEDVALGLGDLGGLKLNLLVADSLVPWEGVRGQQEMVAGTAAALMATYATVGERERNAAFFGNEFHAVVGNPPYITPKDPKKTEAYRAFWPASCYMRYALTVPFAERFFRLPAADGLVGMITANSFMKRQFGKALIEEVLPSLDVTHIVDTQGAHIPGHGTPTVILFGRHRVPHPESTIRCVLGRRGEKSTPDDPAQAPVWMSIVAHTCGPESEDEYISATNTDRAQMTKHPWSLAGGGSGDLRQPWKALPRARRSEGSHASDSLPSLSKTTCIFRIHPPFNVATRFVL